MQKGGDARHYAEPYFHERKGVVPGTVIYEVSISKRGLN